MNHIIARIAACAFITFFIAIVVIADRGEGNQWWAFINDIPNGDKLGHIVLIGTLSLVCNLAIRSHPRSRLTRWITLPTLVLFALLTLEELAQALIPTRTCDFFDWLADLVGLALGQLVAAWISSMITAPGKSHT